MNNKLFFSCSRPRTLKKNKRTFKLNKKKAHSFNVEIVQITIRLASARLSLQKLASFCFYLLVTLTI